MTLDELRPTLLSLIPDVTAPGLTLAEIMNVIQRRLIAGKALDTHLNQIEARLKTLTGVDVMSVDDGLALAEAQQKTLTERLGTSYAREIELTRDLTEAKTRLQTAGKESADLARALHLAEDKINKQITTLAERSTLAQFRDDMRTVLGEKTATAKYMVDTVDEMRRDLTTIKNVLGMDRTVTTSDVLLQIGTQIKVLDRVRDAIGLRESAPMDYVVQRICDTRRDLHWAQGTLSMVSAALSSSHTAERTEIMARLSGTIKAQERFATLSNGLCDDLDMPTGDMDAVRRRVRDLVMFEQDVIRTMGGSDRDQVRDGIGVLQSEYKAQTDTFTILRQILRLGVGCALTTIVETVDRVLFEEKTLRSFRDDQAREIKSLRSFRDDQAREIKNLRANHAGPALVQDRLALIRFLDMAESTTWHEITNEVVRRISYKDGVLAGIGDSIKTLAQIVGLDPTVASLPVPSPLPSVIAYVTAIRDSLLAVAGHPGGESLSLNAALSLVQSKVSGVGLSLGLSEYASLDSVKNKIAHPSGTHQALADLNKILRRELSLSDAMSTAVSEISGMRAARDDQARQIKGQREVMLKQCQRLAQVTGYGPVKVAALEMHVDKLMFLIENMAHALDMPKTTTLPALIQRITCLTPIMAGYRARILTLLCEDPNRAGTLTTDEVVNLLKSKFACLALNLSLPEDATLNTIMERIQGMTGSMPALRELVLTLHSTKTMDPNEAMTAAADKIKDLRQGLLDLLNAS